MRRRVSDERITLEDALAVRPRGFAATAATGHRRIVVPRTVRIRDGAVEWSHEEPGWDHRWSLADYEHAQVGPWCFGKSDQEILRRFIRLSTGSDEDIAAFARRYGVLYLNARGAPGGESTTAEYRAETVFDVKLKASPRGGVAIDPAGRIRPVLWRREPLQVWRDWALIVRLLLLYGRKLRDARVRIDPIALLNDSGIDVPPYTDDQDRWYWSEPRALVAAVSVALARPGNDDYRATSLAEQRRELGGWLDLLVDRSAATLRVDWKQSGRPITRIGRPREGASGWLSGEPNDVFGDVMAQLLTTLLGDSKVNVCPDCGIPYDCAHRRGFCPACRDERRRATRRATWHSHPEYNDRRRRQETGSS